MKITNTFKKTLLIFSILVLALQAVSAANLGYWGGTVTIDGVQAMSGVVVSIYADGVKIREDTLGEGSEIPPEYYLLYLEESEGKNKSISFRVEQKENIDSDCYIAANEVPPEWVLGGNVLDLTFNKLNDGTTTDCAFQCASNNYCAATNDCGSCPSSGGGGGGGGIPPVIEQKIIPQEDHIAKPEEKPPEKDSGEGEQPLLLGEEPSPKEPEPKEVNKTEQDNQLTGAVVGGGAVTYWALAILALLIIGGFGLYYWRKKK